MKFTGDISFNGAARGRIRETARCALLRLLRRGCAGFATKSIRDHYTAVLETKVAYLKFKFNVAVEVARADPPREIEAKIEGTPLGIVGRLTATLADAAGRADGGTKMSYEVDAALTGKLGSLGQPVLRAKAKEMERQFTERMRAAFRRTPEPETAT